MIMLNDYLYEGHTVMNIIRRYYEDLKKDAKRTGNQIDLAHCNFLVQMIELLEHNDFLSSQAQRIREFYKYMSATYPFLSFTFKGRIKSLIRSEEKFNGYITEFVSEYHEKTGTYPSAPEIKDRLNTFRDVIAYRIIISLPKCHVFVGQDQEEEELRYLYEIANTLPGFLEERGFTAEPSYAYAGSETAGPLLSPSVAPYYRDYIANPKPTGYQSLHITFFDNIARCQAEVQLRTKQMDDNAEIGQANHGGYEKEQEIARTRRGRIPSGECQYFDDAYERVRSLKHIDLSKLDVNMFTAYDKDRINDGCGLYRGRLIQPFEHLSGYQNDLID